MPSKITFPIVPAVCALLLAAGCASTPKPVAVAVVPKTPTPVPLPKPAPEPQPDPVAVLIANSDRHFESGQKELSLGHLEKAKVEFNQALDVLLESPDGARSNPRLREHFDRLVDRISVLEQAALTTGDGFSETKSEPAAIDSLLAIETFETTSPKPATAEQVQADLQATAHDIPIPTNDRVLRYVELFQGRLREFLTEGLSRGVQYLPMIQSTFRAEGLPLDLAYIPLIESAFKPSALSKAKARGVWQFMRGTALENGLKADWYLDERADPTKATQAAAKYLKTLHNMFEDWHLAMASYNGGPGRVKNALTRSRKNDFWQLSSTRYLPRETRDYVPMILAAIIIAKNPVQYGFDITPMAPPAIETVVVPPALDLRRVAEWAGVPMDDIQALNPEFRRWTTPVKKGEYTIKVPQGTADKVREGLAAAAPGQLNAMQMHTVKRGETLATIAKKLQVSRADLAEANYLKVTSRVAVGARLIIPRMPSAALLARASAGELETAAETIVADVLKDTAPLAATVAQRRTYQVKRGDTLGVIARRTGTTISQLMNWNKLRTTNLKVGTRLLVQAPRR